MATLPAFLRRTESGAARGPEPVRPGRDEFQLRPLPHDHVYFYSKKIDNSRLEREADPKSGRKCWSAVGAACAALILLGGLMAPPLANTIAGYKLESLRADERRLLDEKRAAELQEAQLLSPERLEQIARDRNLVVPGPGQVVRLNPSDDAVAMVKQ